jgi:1,4-dihydroxy-2-naphthoate polyprenyltransferase
MNAMSPGKALLLATRPRTLVAGVVPVAVGSAVAYREGHFALLPALAALVGALFIQIGTNLANDYFDFRKGADTAERLGPPRATQQGWLSPRAVLTAALVSFGLAMLVGVYLVSIAGLPILLIGLVSVLAGYAYTGGPFPLAYNGLGDVFVLVFFGLVAVAGTTFVQTLQVSPLALVAGLPVGCLGVALLAVNNTRDRTQDEKVGKRTLVVRFGDRFGRAEWFVMVAVAMLVPVGLWTSGWASAWACLAVGSAPLAMMPGRLVAAAHGITLNQALAGTAKLQLAYGVLFAVGLAMQ